MIISVTNKFFFIFWSATVGPRGGKRRKATAPRNRTGFLQLLWGCTIIEAMHMTIYSTPLSACNQ